jgi:hypothetical protein
MPSPLSSPAHVHSSPAAVNRIVTASLTETTSISESLSLVRNKSRSLSTETVVVTESAARRKVSARSLATETSAISESLARLKGAARSLGESLDVSADLARIKAAARAFSEASDISETIARLKAASRSLAEATDVDELLERQKAAARALTETSEIDEALDRTKSLSRAFTESNDIAEALERMSAKARTLTESQNISDTLSKQKTISRALTEAAIAIAASLARMAAKARAVVEAAISLTEQVTTDKVVGINPGGGVRVVYRLNQRQQQWPTHQLRQRVKLEPNYASAILVIPKSEAVMIRAKATVRLQLAYTEIMGATGFVSRIIHYGRTEGSLKVFESTRGRAARAIVSKATEAHQAYSPVGFMLEWQGDAEGESDWKLPQRQKLRKLKDMLDLLED